MSDIIDFGEIDNTTEVDEQIVEPSEPKEVPVEPQNEQDLARTRLIIQLYQNEFPNLPKISNAKLIKMNAAELNGLREEYNLHLSMTTGFSIAQQSLVKSISLLENAICMFTPIQAQGLSETLLSGESFRQDLKLVALKHCDRFTTSPEVRCLFSIANTTLALHAMNVSGLAKQKEEIIAKMETVSDEDFGDL